MKFENTILISGSIKTRNKSSETLPTEIIDLENFFKITQLPTDPIQLSQCEKITNAALFVRSHLDIVRAQAGNPQYKVCLERLIEFKKILMLTLN